MKNTKSPKTERKDHHVGYLFLGLVLIAIGLFLLFYPTESVKTIGYIIASAALVFGLLCLIHTLSGLRRGIRFALSMLGSISTIICAAVLFFTVEETFATFVSIIGLLIVVDASFKLQTVVLSHRYGQKAYWILLVVACIAIFGGYLCIRTAFEDVRALARLLGLTLIVSGLGNLLSTFYLPSFRRHEIAPAPVESEKKPDALPESEKAAESLPESEKTAAQSFETEPKPDALGEGEHQS